MLGGSSFRFGCLRSGTGLYGLDDDVVAVGSMNAFQRKLDHHLTNVRGIFKHLFFPLLIAIHDDLLLEACVDPGKPGETFIVGGCDE